MCTEAGLANGKSVVFDRQVKFLQNLRVSHVVNYIPKTIEKAVTCQSPMGKRIKQVESCSVPLKERTCVCGERIQTEEHALTTLMSNIELLALMT